MFLNALLHQSLTTFSSSKKAITGSLETAVSSMQTSVTSVPSIKEKITTNVNDKQFNLIVGETFKSIL